MCCGSQCPDSRQSSNQWNTKTFWSIGPSGLQKNDSRARRFPDFSPAALALAPPSLIEQCLKGVNYFKTKAKRLGQIAALLLTKHAGRVPATSMNWQLFQGLCKSGQFGAVRDLWKRCWHGGGYTCPPSCSTLGLVWWECTGEDSQRPGAIYVFRNSRACDYSVDRVRPRNMSPAISKMWQLSCCKGAALSNIMHGGFTGVASL